MAYEQAGYCGEKELEQMAREIVPQTTNTKGLVNYSMMDPIPGSTSRILGIESLEPLPGVEAVGTYRGKYFYIGAVAEKAFVDVLKQRAFRIGVEFETLRHAFVPPSDATMRAIRTELSRRHGTNVNSVIQFYPIVEGIITVEALRKGWLAIQ